MAAERPENADERLVADALQRAFGGPVPGAAFLAGREAVQAAAALAAEEATADAELVTAALTGAFATEVDAETKTDQIAAIQTAAQSDNVIPLRRFGAQVGRHAVAAMVAVSTLAGGTGVAAASTDALPGEALYSVKRAVEQVMLTAAFTPGFEARLQATLAARRLDEAEQLLAGGAGADVVGPLLSEYEQHVAVVERLDVTSAEVRVAVLEVKAEALREQTTTATALADSQGEDAPLTSTTPTEMASPAATATEAATAAPEASTTTAAEPEPTPAADSGTKTTTTSEPTSSSSGSGGTSSSTQPAPTTDSSPKPSPTPTATASPKAPSEADPVDEGKNKPPGQDKPKPNDPTPAPDEPTPTANPDREPLPDGEETSEIGPLADWEERATYTDAE